MDAYPFHHILGEVTGDGAITAEDAAYIMRFVVCETPIIVQLVADVSRNG
jgi:hypothetical protein